MAIDKKIQYLRISLGMCGVGVTDMTAETILRVLEAMEKMGGNFSLNDASLIEFEIEEKYSTKSQSDATLDALGKFCGETRILIQEKKNVGYETKGEEIVELLTKFIETNR